MLNSTALRSDASPSEPTGSCLKSQSHKRAARRLRKTLYDAKSEFPCMNNGPINVGDTLEPGRCNTTLRYTLTVTYITVHVTEVVRLVKGPHTADLLMKAQLPKIAQLPLVIQYHTWHTRVR